MVSGVYEFLRFVVFFPHIFVMRETDMMRKLYSGFWSRPEYYWLYVCSAIGARLEDWSFSPAWHGELRLIRSVPGGYAVDPIWLALNPPPHPPPHTQPLNNSPAVLDILNWILWKKTKTKKLLHVLITFPQIEIWVIFSFFFIIFNLWN